MTRYYRKIIQIKATDSPNVRLGIAEKKLGRKPTNTVVVPGVLTYAEYRKRRITWDKVRQCIGLDAEFYEGAENLLFPAEWLDVANGKARELGNKLRCSQATVIGCDPGEGSANTCWSVINRQGLINLISKPTPDTSTIVNESIALIRYYKIDPENLIFDRGGGGKQHADTLRSKGFQVRTVAFGESVTPEPHYGREDPIEKVEHKEERYAYSNRRAQMYHLLSMLLDPNNPDNNGRIFAIPEEYTELRRQLAPLPKLYDGEGRIRLPPKNKRNPNSKEQTLLELLGCSPDEADSLVIAVYGMLFPSDVYEIGAIVD